MTTMTTRWSTELLTSWDAQQAGYLPRREERFRVITKAVEALTGPAPMVVDLGCGPGSLAERVLAAIPGSRCVAVDADPLLLALGRAALADRGDRLRFVEADLRDPDWAETANVADLDAVVSTTALHWLDPAALVAVYDTAHRLLRPGGVVLNGDNLDYPADRPRLSSLAAASFAAAADRAFGENGVPGWDDWWALAEAEPALAAAAALRRDRQRAALAKHPARVGHGTLSAHLTALTAAGFVEVDTLWQDLDDRVVVGIKAS